MVASGWARMSLFGRSGLDGRSWRVGLRRSAPILMPCLAGILLAWLVFKVVFFDADKAGSLALYNSSGTVDSVAWGVATAGDNIWGLLIFWLFVFRRERYDWTSAMILAVAVVASMASVLLLKAGFNLPRPFSVLPQVMAKGEVPPPADPGFPSGHTTMAFTAAGVVWARYQAWRVPFLGLGVATGVSMVILGLHFPSDVVAGGFLGTLSAAFAVSLGRLREEA